MKIAEYGKPDRETVLLLHGGGLSWWDRRAAAELLADRFHVVLPVLDGHAGSGAAFTGIGDSADRLLAMIDRAYGGTVPLIGGLSLGAQILTEMLARRPDICRLAIIESASVIPSRATAALIGPAFSLSYGLIRRKWFAKAQFRYLRMPEDLFEEYYRDTRRIEKRDMIAFLKASAGYAARPELAGCRAEARIIAGGKEQGRILRSAEKLHALLPRSVLEIKDGLYHGEYSICHPEEYVREILEMTGA